MVTIAAKASVMTSYLWIIALKAFLITAVLSIPILILLKRVAIKALFPDEPTRRAFFKTVGKTTALAAIASVLPIATLQEAAAIDTLKPEKSRWILAFTHFMRNTAHYGRSTWLLCRTRHQSQFIKTGRLGVGQRPDDEPRAGRCTFLAPMPIAINLGLGSAKQNMKVAAIQNTNGQALVMALKHKNNRNPKTGKV